MWYDWFLSDSDPDPTVVAHFEELFLEVRQKYFVRSLISRLCFRLEESAAGLQSDWFHLYCLLPAFQSTENGVRFTQPINFCFIVV